MSRIGKEPVAVPAGVTVKVDGRKVSVKGKLGELSYELPAGIAAKQDGGTRHKSGAKHPVQGGYPARVGLVSLVGNVLERLQPGRRRGACPSAMSLGLGRFRLEGVPGLAGRALAAPLEGLGAALRTHKDFAHFCHGRPPDVKVKRRS